MPTHRKYTMPTRMPACTANRKSSRFEAKNSVTLVTSRTRLTRDAKAPYAGTSARSSTAWPADE